MLPLGTKIRQIRVRRGLSQYELADILGAVQGAITRKETQSTGITLKDIRLLSETLHFDIRFFFMDMDISAADLENPASKVLNEIENKLVKLDEQRLARVKEFIATL